MSTLLEVKDITKIYPNQPKPGLDHVSFEVMQGEFLGIMGASGSGKTTLLNVLSTIDIPTSGSIRMGGKKIQELSQTQAADFRKNNLGFIFQEYFLLDSLTVQENIAVPLTLLHESAKTIDKKVMELAELLFALSEVNQALGTTILMVTHDPYAASYTDRILYFKDGHIISELKRCNRERREFYEEIMQEAARQDEKR